MKRLLITLCMLLNGSISLAERVTDPEKMRLVHLRIYDDIVLEEFKCTNDYKLVKFRTVVSYPIIAVEDPKNPQRLEGLIYLPMHGKDLDAADLMITPGSQPVITINNYIRAVYLNPAARDPKHGDEVATAELTTTADYNRIIKIKFSGYKAYEVDVGTIIDPKIEVRKTLKEEYECWRP